MDSSDGSHFFKTCEGSATYPVRYTYDVYGNKTTMTTYRHEPDGGVEHATPPTPGVSSGHRIISVSFPFPRARSFWYNSSNEENHS